LKKDAKRADAEEGKKVDPLDLESVGDTDMSEVTSVYGDSEFDEIMEDDTQMEELVLINMSPDVKKWIDEF